MRPEPAIPKPGQESVWDYPRPPRLEPVTSQVEVIFGGQTIAITLAAMRVLETSHPPNYYLPPDSVVPGCLIPSAKTTWCEYKGTASYFTVVLGDARAPDAAWTYAEPSHPYQAMAGYVSFYPALMEVCLVDGDLAQPQPGGFYGGWVTSRVAGPFKGGPGTQAW